MSTAPLPPRISPETCQALLAWAGPGSDSRAPDMHALREQGINRLADMAEEHLDMARILDILGDRMVKRTFDPGFRIALHQKDLNLALSAAKQLGLALPATSTAQQLFSACVSHGGTAWDHSGMVRALEKLSNFEIGQKPA